MTAAPNRVEFGRAQREFPESITSTADGTLYTGSIGTGEIYRARPGDAQASVFLPAPQTGPTAGLGVFVDEPNGVLWTCHVDLSVNAAPDTAKPSVVRRVDLTSGSVIGTYELPRGSLANDLATLADGTAFVADTAGGRIVRVNPANGTVDTWLADSRLQGVDGISFGPDGMLYVNNVRTGLFYRVALGSDGASGALQELELSQPMTGPDGMRFAANGRLFVAENGSGRVSEVAIDGARAIVTVLRDSFDAPVAVTVVDNTLWVLEAHIHKMRTGENPGAFYAHAIAIS